MADNYTTLGSYATVQVTGPTTTVDVLRISFRTIPSGVVAVANVPYRNVGGFAVADVQTAANIFIGPLATGIERMMGSGMVAAAAGVEDTDASGLLVDYIDAVVEYVPQVAGQLGEFQSELRIPVHAFDEPSFYGPLVGDKLNAAYTALQQLAEL